MIILAVLLVPIFVSWFTNALDFLFIETRWGATTYGLVVTTVTLYYFIIWITIKSRSTLREDGLRRVAGDFMRFIGFSKESLKYAGQNVVSLLLGPLAAGLTVLSLGAGAHISIPFGAPFEFWIQILLVTPIFEEVIFRGIYLKAFVGFFGEGDLSALVGVLTSSLVFGYIHAELISLKVLGGIVLSGIYLYKWRGNLVACVLAHFSVNLFILFVSYAIV